MTYVLSDIHGNLRRFESIMAQINLQPDDTLYVLGDVIDRYPDGIKILRRIMQMPNAKMLIGNHEYMMLKAIGHCKDAAEEKENTNWRQRKIWYRNGGMVTHEQLKHYRKDTRSEMTKGESEQKNRAMITRIGECYWLRGSNSERKQMAKRIEKMEIHHDRKRYLLQMIGYDPGKEKEKMSYDIHLNDPVTKQTLELDDPHFMRGGTYVVGGMKELCLNITYNYACVFRRPEVLGEGGIRSIYGKTGAESIPVLQKAIEALSDEVDPDYWKPAEGNVKKSLYQLLSMARMRPDGVWDGD